MIVPRAVVAIVTAVVVAALLNTLLLALFTGAWSGPIVPVAHGLLFVTGAAIVMTAPAWILLSLVLLPVVTHRVCRGRTLSMAAFYAGAAALGAVLIVPVALWWGATRLLAAMAAFGAIGGLSIAAFWRRLVLDHLAARRVGQSGAS